jgi:ABC-type proline/glycine betaine transport system permease subunit
MRPRNPAQQRYIRRFCPTIFAYVAVLFASIWAIRHLRPEGALLVVLAVLPAIPVLAVLGVMGLYLAEERDEFIRARLVTSMIGGIGLTLAFTTVWGFLENGGVVPHFETYLAFALWCGSFGLVQCLLNLRDRIAGDGQ